ncbi:MAG: FHIPEP family type III secretion protein [Burkholderiaceae bacterium]|nr:FHIPEP family type III secretion protein [Burkholderiaceae bacterium]
MPLAAAGRTDAPAVESVFARYSDLILVAGVVVIVGLMVLPLPIWLADLLVGTNISIGVLLLLLALYIASPLEFSSFPSVLLMTTLFRLSLSIATTRMILLHADAGHIIATFGKVVAGGNLVVGLVVFLIITVVQFIVIAKGAERVAEVAARFTLDAMPGKQLSIDSDLRSGLTDKDEARRRRRLLELESKLHGSLDGAMKFVKGDAIAGIVIILINLLGGLAIGVLQQDLPVGIAMTRYSILTIGEGLVAQIPALLGAMAAGLIVTRTTDEERDRHLGDAIRKQVTAKPRVLLVAGGICLLMSMVPGFPKAVFVLLGLVAAVSGILLTPALRERIARMRHPALRGLVRHLQTPAPTTATPPPAPTAVALLLRVPSALLAGNAAQATAEQLADLLEEIQLDLGLSLPKTHLHGSQEGDDWELLAFDAPIARGRLEPGATADALREPVRQAIRRNAGLFVGIQETMNHLNRASSDVPDVVKEVMRAVPVTRIAEVLRRLVGESVSIRNLREILEALSDSGAKDSATLLQNVRIALSRQICHRVAPQGTLRAVLPRPELAAELRTILGTGAGAPAAGAEDKFRRIASMLVGSIRAGNAAAVVTEPELRVAVRNMIEAECFDTPVLSYRELIPTLQLVPVAQALAEAA